MGKVLIIGAGGKMLGVAGVPVAVSVGEYAYSFHTAKVLKKSDAETKKRASTRLEGRRSMLIYSVLLIETFVAEESSCVGTVSCEAFIESHGVFVVARFEDVFEACRCCGVEYVACFLEHFETVAVEHLCPNVGIVACCIAVAAEDMVEVG